MEQGVIIKFVYDFVQARREKENLTLDDFLTQMDVPEEERYNIACGMTEWLTLYKMKMDEIADMTARTTGGLKL